MIKLDYFGMSGEGRTVKEAKLDAGAKITTALAADYTPRVYSFGEHTWIVWRTPREIVSGRISDFNKPLNCGTCHYPPGYDFEQVCRSVRYHLAQLGCDISSDEVPTIIREDRQSIKDFSSWLAFQRAYRHAKAQGINDHESHTYACNHQQAFIPTLTV